MSQNLSRDRRLACILREDMPISHWGEAEKGYLLDVRNPVELIVEHVPGAVNIPLHELAHLCHPL